MTKSLNSGGWLAVAAVSLFIVLMVGDAGGGSSWSITIVCVFGVLAGYAVYRGGRE